MRALSKSGSAALTQALRGVYVPSSTSGVCSWWSEPLNVAATRVKGRSAFLWLGHECFVFACVLSQTALQHSGGIPIACDAPKSYQTSPQARLTYGIDYAFNDARTVLMLEGVLPKLGFTARPATLTQVNFAVQQESVKIITI